jgi:methionine synthase I (cobalamin-dependent)/5,10-methylenetetrahydrofolate reductase
MKATQALFDPNRVLIADGAMGSELIGRLPEGAPLHLACVDHPEAVCEVHQRYIAAGAGLIETATFGASRPRLERLRAGDQTERCNAEAVKIAREAREMSGRPVLIAGSMGPLAGVLDLDAREGRGRIAEAHAEQAAVLAGRGADLLMLETFFRLDEMEVAVEAIQRVTDTPIVAMLSFAQERPPHRYAEQALLVDRMAALPVAAVGINCAPGPMGTVEILRHVTETVRPLAVMPNAGMLLQRDGRILMPPATPKYLADFARRSVELGCFLVGGCCGTGPEHIEAMAQAVQGLTPGRRSEPGVEVRDEPVELRSETARPPSRLAGKLARGRFVRLVQLDPPKGTNAESVIQAAAALADHPDVDAVDINSNPLARLRMDSLSLAREVQLRTGLETVPHITPRDASLMGLQAQLLGAWAAGVKNLLAVSGDPSQLGDYPGVHDVYHVDIFELVRSLSRLAEGFDCAGHPIGDPPNFLVGVAVNPAVEDLDAEIDRFRRKIDNGAHFAMTQVFFDWAPFERLVDRFGGTLPIPTMAAVWPLRSLKMALRLHHEVPGILVPEDLITAMDAAGSGAAEVGFQRAAELLAEAPGRCAGVYLIAPFKQPERILPLLDA